MSDLLQTESTPIPEDNTIQMDSTPTSHPKRFSRRDFLHLAAGTAITTLLTACGDEQPAPTPTQQIVLPTHEPTPTAWDIPTAEPTDEPTPEPEATEIPLDEIEPDFAFKIRPLFDPTDQRWDDGSFHQRGINLVPSRFENGDGRATIEALESNLTFYNELIQQQNPLVTELYFIEGLNFTPYKDNSSDPSEANIFVAMAPGTNHSVTHSQMRGITVGYKTPNDPNIHPTKGEAEWIIPAPDISSPEMTDVLQQGFGEDYLNNTPDFSAGRVETYLSRGFTLNPEVDATYGTLYATPVSKRDFSLPTVKTSTEAQINGEILANTNGYLLIRQKGREIPIAVSQESVNFTGKLEAKNGDLDVIKIRQGSNVTLKYVYIGTEPRSLHPVCFRHLIIE
jgi:hypothetical protein